MSTLISQLIIIHLHFIAAFLWLVPLGRGVLALSGETLDLREPRPVGAKHVIDRAPAEPPPDLGNEALPKSMSDLEWANVASVATACYSRAPQLQSGQATW